MTKPKAKTASVKSKGGRKKKDGSKTDSNVKSSRTDSFTVVPTEILDDRRLRKSTGEELSFALLLFFQCDDWGLFEGDAFTMGINLKGRSHDWIEAGMKHMEELGFIERYEAEDWDGLVGRIIGYHDYTWVIERKSTPTQRTKSRYPLPDGTMIASRGMPYLKRPAGWLPEWAKEMLRSRGQTDFDDNRRKSAGSVQVSRKQPYPEGVKIGSPEKNVTRLDEIPHVADITNDLDHQNTSAGLVQVECWDRGANSSLRSDDNGPALQAGAVYQPEDPAYQAKNARAREVGFASEAGSGEPTASGGGTAAAFGRGPSDSGTTSPVLASGTQAPVVADSPSPEAQADTALPESDAVDAVDEKAVLAACKLSDAQISHYDALVRDAGPEAKWPSPAHESEALAWVQRASYARANARNGKQAPLPEAWLLERLKAMAHIADRDGADAFVDAVHRSACNTDLAVMSDNDTGKDAGPLGSLDVLTHTKKLAARKLASKLDLARRNLFRSQTGRISPRPGESLPELTPEQEAEALRTDEERAAIKAAAEEAKHWLSSPWCHCPVEIRGDEAKCLAWLASWQAGALIHAQA